MFPELFYFELYYFKQYLRYPRELYKIIRPNLLNIIQQNLILYINLLFRKKYLSTGKSICTQRSIIFSCKNWAYKNLYGKKIMDVLILAYLYINQYKYNYWVPNGKNILCVYRCNWERLGSPCVVVLNLGCEMHPGKLKNINSWVLSLKILIQLQVMAIINFINGPKLGSSGLWHLKWEKDT